MNIALTGITGMVGSHFIKKILENDSEGAEYKIKALIRENNMAASLAIGGSLLGFCIPLASAITNSGSLADVAVWGIVALLVQILLFYIVRLPIPKISERIEKGEMASGLWLGGASLAGGVLNAASMTS